MSRNIIINELKITKTKAILIFKESDHDRIEKKVVFEGQRPESLQSHIDAIASHIVEDAKKVYEEDSKQTTIFDDEGEEEA